VQDYKPMNWGSYNATAIGWSQSLVNQLQEPNRFPYITASSYKSIGSSSSNIWLAPPPPMPSHRRLPPSTVATC